MIMTKKSSSSIIPLRCRRLLSASNIRRRSFVSLATLFIVFSSAISIIVSTSSYYNNVNNNVMEMEFDAPSFNNNSSNNSISALSYSSTTSTTTSNVAVVEKKSSKGIIVIDEEQKGGELENEEGVVEHDEDDDDYGKEEEEDLDGDDDEKETEDDNNKVSNSTKMMIKPPRPPKSTYLKIDGITNTTLIRQDLSELVDYGYIAFSKCGSTSISSWWRRHREVRQENKESRIMWNGPIRAVNYVYKKFPSSKVDGKKIAYKMPSDIYHPIAMKTINENFPTTKLIIGIRHPILWFESFYNYWQSIANGSSRKYLTKNTTALIGDCTYNEHVCTDNANFQYYISKYFWPSTSSEEESTLTTKTKTLGMKTNKANTTTTTTTTTDATNTTIEPQQSNNNNNNNNNNNVVLTNPLFFYEISQLADTNETRTKQFRIDFQSYLGLSIPLPKPPMKNKINMSTKKRQKYAINICDDIHQQIRNVLMDHSRNLVEWIRNSKFLYGRSDLTVSPSKDHFLNTILESYLYDPCDTRREEEGKENITKKTQNKREFKDIIKRIPKEEEEEKYYGNK